MKIKKMQALCKRAKCVEIIKDISEEGVRRDKRWLSDRRMLAYMGENSPQLPSDIIYTMDLSEDDRLDVEQQIREMVVLPFHMTKPAELLDYAIAIDGAVYRLFSTRLGLLCIDKRRLDVFEDVANKQYGITQDDPPMLAVAASGAAIGYICPVKMPLTDIKEFGSDLADLAETALKNGFFADNEQMSMEDMMDSE